MEWAERDDGRITHGLPVHEEDAEMTVRGRVLIAGLAMFALLLAAEASAAEPQHDFIGAKRCAMCHKTAKVGKQHPLWEASKHAQAYETLASEEAQKIGAELGIDPQQSGQCLRCHATAYWFSEEPVSMGISVEEGVSCESCHGPGKDYMTMSVMKDREAAVAAGLLDADEQTCLKCHNEESPTFRPFDFAESSEKIKHPIPR